MVTMTKKKIITGLIVLAACMMIFTAGCTDVKPTYTIGFETGLTPWEYIDSSGNPQGINIEMVEWIAENQGFTATYVPERGNWEDSLNSKTFDTMGATVIIPERLEKYAFVEMPFEPTRYIVITRADSGLTLNDVLNGNASVALFGNSVYDLWLKNHFGENYDAMRAENKIILKETADELAFSVLSHEADSALAGTMTFSNQLNAYQPLKFLGFVGEPNKLGFVMRKDDTRFHDLFSEGMKNFEKSPEFADLIKKYNLQYKKETYTVGVDGSNVPWTSKDADGNYTGFDIEMIEWIADQNNFRVEFIPDYSWSTNINAIGSGNLDMWASSMTITPERLRYVAFSDPYYTSGIGVGVRPDSQLTKADFEKADAKIATIYGSTYVTWLEKHLGTAVYDKKVRDGSIIQESKSDAIYGLLSSGKCDFVVLGDALILDTSKPEVIKPLFIDEGVESLGVATGKGNFILQDMINDGLQKFESSGKRAELLQKYGL